MTNFPIPGYSPPTEFYCCLFNAFSPEEVAKIIDTIEEQEFQKGTIGRGEVNEGVRESSVAFVDLNEATHWIHQRMAGIMARVNHDKFGLDLDALEVLQYTKYDENGHYGWHVDCHQGEERPVQRKLSISVILSDPKDYEGGDLMVNNHGNQDNPTRIHMIDHETQQPVQLPAGTAVVFYSHLPHCVDFVTRGTRLSLVSWAVGPKLR